MITFIFTFISTILSGLSLLLFGRKKKPSSESFAEPPNFILPVKILNRIQQIFPLIPSNKK